MTNAKIAKRNAAAFLRYLIGMKLKTIGEYLGASEATVMFWVNSEARDRHNIRRCRKRWANGAKARTKIVRAKRSPEAAKIYRLRKMAREEAQETGEPVEQVYARWNVA